jgi:hypothetical protein
MVRAKLNCDSRQACKVVSQQIMATQKVTLAEKEAGAREATVLLGHAYLYDCTRHKLLPKNHPNVRPEVLEVFAELVKVASKYRSLTGRHLPILGELGELFAEIMFGLKRHSPMTQGSDGMLGNDFVEVKTITPDKRTDVVQVKLAGNFGKLVVVKISDDFQFGARMIRRSTLAKCKGQWAWISWNAMIRGEPDLAIHKNFPIKKVRPKGSAL